MGECHVRVELCILLCVFLSYFVSLLQHVCLGTRFDTSTKNAPLRSCRSAYPRFAAGAYGI